MKSNPPRLMITAGGSGEGKTTVTCALLSALVKQNLKTAAFKSGPDYIDPMFHSEILGVKSRNLDIYMCSENTVKYLFAENTKDCDISVVEGAMGIYDGFGFSSDDCSANHLSRILDIPQIMVVNVHGKALSLCAEITGYLNFKKNNIKGIILNGCREAMFSSYKNMVEQHTGISVYGFLPNIDEARIESRHLGLITAAEIKNLRHKLDILGELAEKYIDIDALTELSQNTKNFEYEEILIKKKEDVTIAIARDKAFCFYYEDNLMLLKKLGAKIIEFSPMQDSMIPENASGIIIGGGYPEAHIEKISSNRQIINSLKNAYERGMPIFAECGGFMYLGRNMNINDQSYEMAGIIDTDFFMTDRLVRFGYKELTANVDNIFCKKGESIRCHEFHYSDCNCQGDTFTAQKSGKKISDCFLYQKNLIAGYPHIHLWSNIQFAINFILKCIEYKQHRLFKKED